MKDSDMAVLNHLAAVEDWMSVGDIVNGSVVSESTVRRVLPRLIDQGLVEQRKIARTYEYRTVPTQVESKKKWWFRRRK